jgi:hypothetical protein
MQTTRRLKQILHDAQTALPTSSTLHQAAPTDQQLLNSAGDAVLWFRCHGKWPGLDAHTVAELRRRLFAARVVAEVLNIAEENEPDEGGPMLAMRASPEEWFELLMLQLPMWTRILHDREGRADTGTAS